MWALKHLERKGERIDHIYVWQGHTSSLAKLRQKKKFFLISKLTGDG